MKNKIFLGLLSLVAGFSLASCVEEPLNIPTEPILNESSVVTGSADVTATSATLHGTVEGLDGMASASYMTAFYYGYSADALTESVTASYDGNAFTATLTGLQTNVTVYYQAYVRLQGKVYYKGEVKSLVTTTAKVVTKAASEVGANSAVLGGTVTDAPEGAVCGILISASSEVEKVRAGVNMAAKELAAEYALTRKGLLPDTEYSYVAYLDLGSGVVYGDVESFTTSSQTFDLDNDLVDLGLSVKWAKYNVGAATESELGGLFGFGDLNGVMTSINPADYASADIYKTGSDIANIATGGKTTLPTAADFEELFSLCKKEWTEVEGVAGYRLTGPNGNSIFLPAAGTRTQSAVKGEGTEGYYLTGTVNPTNSQFAVTYQFSQYVDTKTTTPVYQAVAIRPVSVAKNVPFEEDLLYNTWEIDLTEDGEYQTFPGPSYFYGMDDSWATVTNGEPVVGDTWCWDADFAGNAWVVGGDAKNCKGYMTFAKDAETGERTVTVGQYNAEGVLTESKGTFTIDAENKTLTLDVDILAPTNYVAGFVDNRKTDIDILSLTKSSMQLAVVRTDPSQGPCKLSINYIPQLEKYGYTAKLTCYGGNEDTTPDAWGSATMTIPGGEAGLGTYTITFNTEYPRVRGQVYLLEIEGYAAANPECFVRVDAISADGNEVKFDASKFFYGDIESNGTYRIEMANIWGKGHNDAWNGLKDTPFQPGGGETTDETALAFNETFEVTFTIVSITSNGAGDYSPNFVMVNGDWSAQQWGYNDGSKISVKYEDCQYSFDLNKIDMTYEATGYSLGTIMTFVQTDNLYSFFPGVKAVLDGYYADGESVEFDAAKIVNTSADGNGVHHRLELWNCWGETSGAGCAFGEKEGDLMPGLGFDSSVRMTVTYESLFATPVWE